MENFVLYLFSEVYSLNGDFFALMFRMKYINRWGLMRITRDENLSVHSLECALLAHALSVIGNKYFGREYDTDKIVLKALYHDATEILTGDLPTPVKYYDEVIKSAYKAVEARAVDRLLDLLPPELRPEYQPLFEYTEEERKIIKAADKLSAYIKCLEETDLGNREFAHALASTKSLMEELDCEELNYFVENNISSFTKALDELQNIKISQLKEKQ
ncbi:MAG: 5'-deoxynucleotidase [Eubacteriales bacterium]